MAGAADSILVLKRRRGQADAELDVTGRDVEEQEYALRFNPPIGTWSPLGDAGEWSLSETGRNVQNALREHGPLSPRPSYRTSRYQP